MSVVLKTTTLELAEPCWFLAWTQTKSLAGSEKWLRRMKPLYLVVVISPTSFSLENNTRQGEKNKTCLAQNSISGKLLTYVWSATVDCSLWVSGTSALGPMNSAHHQNNSSHHMECNSLEEKDGQGDLQKKSKRKSIEAKEKCLCKSLNQTQKGTTSQILFLSVDKNNPLPFLSRFVPFKLFRV